jgi:hypothetical protein
MTILTCPQILVPQVKLEFSSILFLNSDMPLALDGKEI